MSEKTLYVLVGILIVSLSVSLVVLNNMIEKDEKVFFPKEDSISVVNPKLDSNGCVISTGYVFDKSKGYCVSPEDLKDECEGEYRPVCGMNGVTYDSPCHAGDERIVKFGSC